MGRRWLVLLSVSACTTGPAPSPPGVPNSVPPPAVAVTASAARVEPPAPVPVPSSSAAPGPAPAVRMTELAPTQGALLPLLAAQVKRARDKGLVAVVEFYADWCPPCRTFQQSLDHPRIREALRGAYLVKVNLDDWHDKLDGTGFKVPSIPAFHLINDDGRPSGRMLDGDKWRRPTPDTMSASLAKLLARDG